ncbi:hypothetical protein A6U87_27920 [Rhizobium sp. AC44/96]|jgi:hypothetical protein|nr:hypothetical protein A6U87_27920 [Rhizobium sp. AC44/96]
MKCRFLSKRATTQALVILLALSACTVVLTLAFGRGGLALAVAIATIAACKVRVVSLDFLGLRNGQATMFVAINGWGAILLLVALAQRFLSS